MRDEGRPSAARRAGRGGFTLIELLAVLAMFALVAALVLPSVDFGGTRAVRSEANDLAAAVEFARQRAVMTARAHRVVVDVEGAAHWVEWAAPAAPQPQAAVAAATGQAPLDLVPPPLAVERFEPVPGVFGRVHAADPAVLILGVELGGSLAERGVVELRIDADGAADAAAIVLGDAAGASALRVEVEPLADAARVVDAL